MPLFRRKSGRAPAFGDIHMDDDRDIEVRRLREESRAHFWGEARLLFRDLVFALMIMALVLVFVAQPVKVEGTSMLPRLHDGERIFVNKLIYYGLPGIERGDIVVFWFPNDPSKSYIKRVIGLPGETVQMRAGRIFVNGKELQEPYLETGLNVAGSDEPPTYVKPHYYFVMGDNRDNSSDSRSWGLVPEKYIYGKALFRYWPLSRASVIRHETEYPGIPSYHMERFDDNE
ncbi:MAG: signal peptidase [Acidobacteriota bacterium]|jgi:signal peptidase I|nr:signal peptidase [Acidobacteriota bacterium]